MEGEKVMDTEAVAKLLGLSTSYIRVLMHRHPELRPKQKFGDQWMFTPEEAERLRARPKQRRHKQTT
jgi:hypothetical protein